MSLPQTIKRLLGKRFDGRIRFDEPMSTHTSFRVGGPADVMVWPDNDNDLSALLGIIGCENIDWFVFGGGTNTLVRDGGIRGVVISTTGLNKISSPRNNGEKVAVTVQSGASLGKLCRFSADRGLSGMAFAVGIPGTVGGAVMMNAGIPEGDMSDVLSSVKIMTPSGETRFIDRHLMSFGYRRLSLPIDVAGFPGKPAIVTLAVLTLMQRDEKQVRNETSRLLSRRKQVQPGGFSAGSFFKNPLHGPTAGELIDRAGLKGYLVGEGMVSEKHANFIINKKNASAENILALMEIIQQRVFDAFGVNLEPEVKIIGEKNRP